VFHDFEPIAILAPAKEHYGRCIGMFPISAFPFIAKNVLGSLAFNLRIIDVNFTEYSNSKNVLFQE
jgi:hypothetical protein